MTEIWLNGEFYTGHDAGNGSILGAGAGAGHGAPYGAAHTHAVPLSAQRAKPVAPALIGVDDRGFLLGDGFFETMRAHDGQVAWLARHYDRLCRHAAVIGLPVGGLPTPEQLRPIIARLCAGLIDGAPQDGAQVQVPFDGDHHHHAVIRLTVSRGAGPRGLLPPAMDGTTPTVLITAARFTPALIADGLASGLSGGLPDARQSGMRLHVSRMIRRNPWSIAGRIKSLNYLDNIMARREAAEHGADDVLLLSVDGSIAETGIANVFFIARDGALITPPENGSILPGLAREFVMEWGRAQGMNVVERPIAMTDIDQMDAAFATNALQGLRVIGAIDGSEFAPGVAAWGRMADIANAIENSLMKRREQ